jgi:hypothetical protein
MMLIITPTKPQTGPVTPDMGKAVSIPQALAFARSRKPMAVALPKRRKRK